MSCIIAFLLDIQNPRHEINTEENDINGNNAIIPRRPQDKRGNRVEKKVFKDSEESKERALESMESNALMDLMDFQIDTDYADYKGGRKKTKCTKGKKKERKNVRRQ